MTLLLFVAPAVLAAVLSWSLAPLARRVAIGVGAVDKPGPRKIHSTPTPRLGGLTVLFSAAAVFAVMPFVPAFRAHLLSPEVLFGVAAGLVPIAVTSLLDDIHGQRVIVKLASHLVGATIAVSVGIRLNGTIHFLGNQIHIGWLAIPISILWLAGITNAFNLIDGLDGLSAGLALISSASLAAVSIVTHNYEMAAGAMVIGGALLGFLPFNLYPAKMYLGDTGATAIGFFLGVLTLSGGSTTSAGLAVTLPIVVLGVPVADTLLSMLRRLMRSKSGAQTGMFVADRNHIHHRLLALGFQHKQAVLLLYGIGVLLAVFGFASLFMTQQNGALLLGALLIAAVVGVSKLGYDEFAMVKSGAVLRAYEVPVLRRGFFVVFVDLAIIAAALYASLGLKYDDWGVQHHRDMLFGIAALVPTATLAMFALLRIYRRSWSNASIDDVVKLATALIIGSVTTYLVARLTMPTPPAATFIVTYTLVMLVLAVGLRVSYRVLYHWNRRSNRGGDLVLIYGAGISGTLALREILANSAVPMNPIGFIDDDPQLKGRFVNGYPVLGCLDDLEELVVGQKALGVVIASHKIPIAKVQSAREVCESLGAWMRVFSVNFTNVAGVEGDTDAA
jgi:UDP-GlcNAc:undecaprenyl-phosphate/decaprenyl-phosphate GlcNAc-1-phosphate transferase